MTAASLTAVVAVLLVGVLICVAPALTRPTLQFGVRVPPQHTGAAVIRRERRAYYWRTAAVVLCCTAAALALAGTGSARLTAIVLPAELAAGLGCFWVARERITAVKNAEGWFAGLRQAVVADTSWRTEPLRFPVVWLIPPVAVLVATAIIGATRYPDLPSRVAVGFTASGAPDRWVSQVGLGCVLQGGRPAVGDFPVDRVAADNLPLPARHRCFRGRRFGPPLPQLPGDLLPGAAGAGDADQCQPAAGRAPRLAGLPALRRRRRLAVPSRPRPAWSSWWPSPCGQARRGPGCLVTPAAPGPR